MVISLKSSNGIETLKNGDLIALLRQNKFIGYGEILEKQKNKILVELDNNSAKVFTEIYSKNIPFDFEIG